MGPTEEAVLISYKAGDMDLPTRAIGILITRGGKLALVFASGETCTMRLLRGHVYPLSPTRILKKGSTAKGYVLLEPQPLTLAQLEELRDEYILTEEAFQRATKALLDPIAERTVVSNPDAAVEVTDLRLTDAARQGLNLPPKPGT